MSVAIWLGSAPFRDFLKKKGSKRRLTHDLLNPTHFDQPQYQYVYGVPVREELTRPLNHFVNQTLYCSQTTAETETETVEYIGEIMSQPPSIAARSIMHTKVNCSLISATRRTTCFFIRGFGELPQTCGTGEQSRTCSGMFQVSNVFFCTSPNFLEIADTADSRIRHWESRTLRSIAPTPGYSLEAARSPEWQAERSTQSKPSVWS